MPIFSSPAGSCGSPRGNPRMRCRSLRKRGKGEGGGGVAGAGRMRGGGVAAVAGGGGYNRGIASKEMGLRDEAAGEFRLSRTNPSLFLGASYLLAGTLAEKGEIAAAVETLDEVLASEHGTDTEMRDVRYQKAGLLSRRGNEEEAR